MTTYDHPRMARVLLGWEGTTPEARRALRRLARQWLREIGEGHLVVLPRAPEFIGPPRCRICGANDELLTGEGFCVSHGMDDTP